MRRTTEKKTDVVSETEGPQRTPGDSFRHYQRRRLEAVQEVLFHAGELCVCTGTMWTRALSGICIRCGKVAEVTWRTPWPH